MIIGLKSLYVWENCDSPFFMKISFGTDLIYNCIEDAGMFLKIVVTLSTSIVNNPARNKI